jgi:hypothetical protein
LRFFFTVQGPEDADRLLSGGEPWPSSDTRANLGPGVYAWADASEATAYEDHLASNVGAKSLRILELEISEETVSGLRQLHLDTLSDEEADAWLRQYAALWAFPSEPEEHGFDYVSRPTQFGVEHYFKPAVYPAMTWSE